MYSLLSAVYLTILLCMSGLSVASTVLVLFLHHKEGAYRIRWSDYGHEVHNSRYYRVYRSPRSNNNRNMHTGKNGIKPSVSQSLLRDKYNKESDIDTEPVSSLDDEEECQNRCKYCFSWKKTLVNQITKRFVRKVDTVLFWIVTILTCLTTVTILIILCNQ